MPRPFAKCAKERGIGGCEVLDCFPTALVQAGCAAGLAAAVFAVNAAPAECAFVPFSVSAAGVAVRSAGFELRWRVAASSAGDPALASAGVSDVPDPAVSKASAADARTSDQPSGFRCWAGRDADGE